MKAYGYIRVSTEEQAVEGISLDAQRSTIERYCMFKNYSLSDIYEDAGVSTRYPLSQRGGGSRLLTALRFTKQAHIITCKLDRLFRDTIECLETVKQWDKQGATLHLIDMGGQTMDTQSAMGKFFITMMAGVAELERNQIRDRVKFALQHKKRQGKRTSGQLPYGYRLDEDGETLLPHDEERGNLAFIHEMREEGLSLRKIVDRLNKSPRRPRGKQWYLTTVAKLLRREEDG